MLQLQIGKNHVVVRRMALQGISRYGNRVLRQLFARKFPQAVQDKLRTLRFKDATSVD